MRAFQEYFSGYQQDPEQILRKTFEETDGYDEMVVLRGVPFSSHCEHHVAPIVGRAWVAYIPHSRVVGISKLARVVEAYAKRLQIQERLTAQIANAIERVLKPQGVGVVIKATHHCMSSRGVNIQGTDLVTSRMLGSFRDNPMIRQEFLSMVHAGDRVGGPCASARRGRGDMLTAFDRLRDRTRRLFRRRHGLARDHGVLAITVRSLGDIALADRQPAGGVRVLRDLSDRPLIFAVYPALKSGSLTTALIYGALFGFFTYATYDLTNQATLRNWTWSLTWSMSPGAPSLAAISRSRHVPRAHQVRDRELTRSMATSARDREERPGPALIGPECFAARAQHMLLRAAECRRHAPAPSTCRAGAASASQP